MEPAVDGSCAKGSFYYPNLGCFKQISWSAKSKPDKLEEVASTLWASCLRYLNPNFVKQSEYWLFADIQDQWGINVRAKDRKALLALAAGSLTKKGGAHLSRIAGLDPKLAAVFAESVALIMLKTLHQKEWLLKGIDCYRDYDYALRFYADYVKKSTTVAD